MSNNGKRLLVSLAHPDDESFGMGGTIARYVNEGVEAYLICATNGDVGTADPEFLKHYRSMADLRLAELDCAAQTLRLKEVFKLGYRDSGVQGSPDNTHPDCLAQADLDDVTRRVTEIIRRVQPQVVVTFDPFGGYGHPDHIMMHRATTRAFEAASDPSCYPEQVEAALPLHRPHKLYYRTMDRSLLRLEVRLMPLFGKDPTRMGRNKDINVREIAEHQYPIHARIAVGDYADVAEKASKCHASQLGGLRRPTITQTMYRLMHGVTDMYMRAYPAVDGQKVRERDLFEGIEGLQDSV